MLDPSGTLDSLFSMVLYHSAYVKILLHLTAAAILAILLVCLPAAAPPSYFSSCFHQSPDRAYQVQVHSSSCIDYRTNCMSRALSRDASRLLPCLCCICCTPGIVCVPLVIVVYSCIMSFMRYLP